MLLKRGGRGILKRGSAATIAVLGVDGGAEEAPIAARIDGTGNAPGIPVARGAGGRGVEFTGGTNGVGGVKDGRGPRMPNDAKSGRGRCSLILQWQ